MASSLIIKIDGDTKSLEQSLNNAGSVAKKSMAIATTAVVALGTAATMVGKEFESSMAMVSTLFGDVNVDVDNLNNSVLALSSSSGYAAKELADSLYNALSAGVVVTEDMSEAMDFMEQSTKLAIGAGAELGDVVDAQTSILNAYKLGVEETDTVQKILMQTQNKGKTTVAELSASIANVIPTAAALGVEFDQVGAALATMTAQGTDTSKATTQLNTLLAELGKEGTVASSILYDLTGSSFQELTAQGKDLSDVLNLLTVNLSKDSQAISQMMNVVNTATGENYTFEESLAQLGLSASDVEGELLNMFGSVEAGKAALSLAGSNSETFKENLEAMGTSADVVGDAYDTMTDTVDHQLSRLVENVKNAGIKLYDNFKEPLEEIIKEMADFVASFDVDAALESLQELYNKFSWLLPIIAGVVSAFVALTAVMKISSFIKSISTAFTLLNTVMAANPILLVVMAIAALVAALVTAYATSETFRNTVNAVFESVKSFIISAIDTIKNTIATIGEWFTNVYETIKNVMEAISNAIQAGFNYVIDAISTALQFISDIISNIVDFWVEIITNFVNVVVAVFQTWYNSVLSVVNGIKNIFLEIIDFIINVFTGNWSGAWENIVNIFKGIFETIVAYAKAPINMVITLINGMINAINIAIKALNKMSFKVPDWIPGIGGQEWGFNLSTIANVPYLATGAVLKPNDPFLAVVGDQKRGTNIEAPLDTIKQALQEVVESGSLNNAMSGIMVENGSGLNTANVSAENISTQSSEQIPTTITSNVYLDGDPLFRSIENVKLQRGANIGLGVYAR